MDLITADCVGCGFCCTKVPCEAARRVYGPVTVCPSLEWNGSRHICKLMELPGDIGAGFRVELYAGAGCCANLNSWRHEPLIDRRPNVYLSRDVVLDSTFQIFLHCLGREFISPDTLSLTILSMVGELIKSGYSEPVAKAIGNKVLHYLRGERTKSIDSFMGDF